MTSRFIKLNVALIEHAVWSGGPRYGTKMNDKKKDKTNKKMNKFIMKEVRLALNLRFLVRSWFKFVQPLSFPLSHKHAHTPCIFATHVHQHFLAQVN